jgi:hypothetical protein
VSSKVSNSFPDRAVPEEADIAVSGAHGQAGHIGSRVEARPVDVELCLPAVGGAAVVEREYVLSFRMRPSASVGWSGGLIGGYVEIGALNTWYDEQGEGEPLMLLHGGMCTNATWAAQMPAFGAHFRVIAPERRGHGHTPDLEGALSYDVMSADTIEPGAGPLRPHRPAASCA